MGPVLPSLLLVAATASPFFCSSPLFLLLSAPPPLLSSPLRVFLLPFAPFLFPARLLVSFRYLPFWTPLANPRRVLLLGIIVPCLNVQRDRRRVHPTVSREFTVSQPYPVPPTRLVHPGTNLHIVKALNVTTELCLAQCTIPGFILCRGDCYIHDFL